MAISSKLNIENSGMLVSLVFYAIVAILCFVALFMANFPPHIGILGIFNLITAYGLFRKRAWVLWIVVVLFFVGTTFSAYTLLVAFGKDLLFDISMISYLILTWVFTAYVAARRRKLES
jgi:hypothetical protein